VSAFRLGSRDPAVAQIRGWLIEIGLLAADTGEADEAYTPAVEHAVRAIQQQRGLPVDGIVGPDTYRELEGARWRLGGRTLHHHVSHPYAGDDVLMLQQRLSELGFDVGRPDGHFGPRTATALRDFQRNYGLAVDGTVGPDTVRALRQLSRSVVRGRSYDLREAEALRHRGPRLAGKKVVVDPGHGGAETGWCVGALTERDIVADLARRLEGRLAAYGAEAYLTHGPDSCPTAEERAAFANATDADLLVSLHVDGAPSPAANGVATFYYGAGPSRGSVAGGRLADLVQRELVARTDFADAHTHPRTWELLRRTRMTAVQVELGYLTNPGDARRLGDPDLRDRVAEALLVAIQRLFLPDDLDPPTGVLYLPALTGG
jgi:N-acetylmuramoyl-L-alanine amidase